MPSIPITDVTPRIQYTATSGQTDFAVPFVFFYDTVNFPNPLSVYLTADGAEPSDYDDILVLTTDYTITQDANYTGTVVLNSGATEDDRITIVRAMTNQRMNYYQTGGSFTANAVNTDFESEVLFIQQNKLYNEYMAPHYPLSSVITSESASGGGDVILPVLTAGQVWVKDPTNSYITTATFAGGSSIAWLETPSSTTMAAGYGYAVSTGSTVTLTTPASLEFGDVMEVALVSGGEFVIQLQAGQTMRFGSDVSSAGGTLTSQAVGDTLKLLVTSSTTIMALSGISHNYSFS